MNGHQPRRSNDLDETLEETFPASDAPANTVETGIRVGADDVLNDRPADTPGARIESAPTSSDPTDPSR